MKKSWLLVFLLALLFFAGPLSAAVTDHAPLIAKYEGTKTCLECHKNAGREVAESLHYQQQSQAKFLKDWPADNPVGMMVSY